MGEDRIFPDEFIGFLNFRLLAHCIHMIVVTSIESDNTMKLEHLLSIHGNMINTGLILIVMTSYIWVSLRPQSNLRVS